MLSLYECLAMKWYAGEMEVNLSLSHAWWSLGTASR